MIYQLIERKNLTVSFPGLDGVETFTQFLRSEFSEENIEFWLACEEFKSATSPANLQSMANQMYAVFIDAAAPKEVKVGVPYISCRFRHQKKSPACKRHCTLIERASVIGLWVFYKNVTKNG